MQFCQDAGLELPVDLFEADRLTPYAAAIRYGLGDPRAVPTRMPCDGRRLPSSRQTLSFNQIRSHI
jgi:hypothetical protein